MGHFCLVLSGEWRCSQKSVWDFFVDKERLSRVLLVDDSFDLTKLKKTVLAEYCFPEASLTSLSLSYWPLNVDGFATNTKTPPVMLTNDASVSYFVMELAAKNAKNLFVRFNSEVKRMYADQKQRSKVGEDLDNVGYTTPISKQARVVSFDLNSEPSPMNGNNIEFSSVGSKSGPGFFADEELLSFIEEEEAREKSGSCKTGESSKSPWDLGLDSESSEEDIDIEDVVPNPGFDTEFWGPLLGEEHGGTNIPEIMWGGIDDVGPSLSLGVDDAPPTEKHHKSSDNGVNHTQATQSFPPGLVPGSATGNMVEVPKRALVDIDDDEFDIPPLFDDTEYEVGDIPDLDKFDENEMIAVGKVFRCKEDLQIFLALHAIKNMFYWVQSRTTVNYVVFSCTDTKCQWRVTAKELKDCGYYKIKTTYLEHTCTIETRRNYKKKATSRVIAAVYKAKYGNPGGAPLTMQLQQMVLEDLRVDVSYMKCWRAGEQANAMVWGTDEESYEKLPIYFHLLKLANPGTITHIETVVDEDGVSRFKYAFLAFGASINGFKMCRRVLVVDGTHLNSKYKGVLLTASSQDANFQVFPVAYAVVDSENDDAWTWFLKKIEEIVSDSDDLTIISDRCQSIYNAKDEAFPKAHHAACIVHLERNIISKFKSKGLSKLVGEAAFAFKIGEFNHKWDRIVQYNPACAAWLKKIGIRHWSRSYFQGKRYNLMTSNIAESLNNALRKGRSSPIVELFRFIQSMMTRWFAARRKKALNHRGGVSIEVEKVMAKNRATFVGSKVNRIDVSTFEVVGLFGGRSTVCLDTKQCTCKGFDLLEIPCGHAMLAADTANVSYTLLVPPSFKTTSWVVTYEGLVSPALHEQNVIVPRNFFTNRFDPPKTKRPSGRQKETRIPSQGELQRTKGSRAGFNKCSRCNLVGHNRTRCTNPI